MSQNPSTPVAVGLAQVHKFFDSDEAPYSLAKFRTDWKNLTDADKADIKAGLTNGSLSY